MAWLATTWTVEAKNPESGIKELYPNLEIALEEGPDGRPTMTRDGVVFLLALPKHLAEKNSILSFDWYGNALEVWEGLRWIGNLYLTNIKPLE
jgi:hypothetical protein